MTNRITQAFVEKQLENLNRMTGMPLSPYHKNDQGVTIPQAGNYHLDSGYGGYKFVRMDTTVGSTGTSNIGNMGYRSLPVISQYIRMFAEGYLAAKGL